MKLEHIGLTVKSHEEIDAFYCKLLGFKRVRNFVLKRDVANVLFGINKNIQVSFLEKDNIRIELFVSEALNMRPIDHICISVPEREALVQRAKMAGYEVIRIKRPEFDLVFLKDGSNNLFEMRSSEK